MTPEIDSLHAATRWLYGLPPSDFVAARNQLVSELKAGRLREVATEVATLRRPTVMAAELNQAVRASEIGLEAILHAAKALLAGQQAALDGDPVDIEHLSQDHRAAAAAVADRAQRDHAEIQALLEAASLDEGLHPALREASFATEPEPQTGFDLLLAQPDATVTSLSEARAKKQAAAQSPEPNPTTGANNKLADEPIDDDPTPSSTKGPKQRGEIVDLEGATKAHDLALRRVEAASKTATQSGERVETAEARLAAARGHLAEATSRLEAANSAEERARARLTAAQEGDQSAPD